MYKNLQTLFIERCPSLPCKAGMGKYSKWK